MHLIVLVTALLMTPQKAPSAPPDADTCLACHTDAQLSTTLGDGSTLSLRVDGSVFAKSVHARLACADCHTGKTAVPHEGRGFQTRRELTLAYDEQCRRCHFTNYTKTLDSVHQASVARGDKTAPVCVDCHGSHDIGGPHQEQWELRTPELCGRCHSNAPLMKKYGLSTAVLSTYLSDFHGKTASLRQNQGVSPTGRVVARCTDCHGVHDIQKATNPDSPVMKANLLKTCRKCHEDANENFPGAWLSHYEPSLSKAPVVYGVKLAYMALIPFMIGGLGLQILLHLWRLMVNR